MECVSLIVTIPGAGVTTQKREREGDALFVRQDVSKETEVLVRLIDEGTDRIVVYAATERLWFGRLGSPLAVRCWWSRFWVLLGLL